MHSSHIDLRSQILLFPLYPFLLYVVAFHLLVHFNIWLTAINFDCFLTCALVFSFQFFTNGIYLCVLKFRACMIPRFGRCMRSRSLTNVNNAKDRSHLKPAFKSISVKCTTSDARIAARIAHWSSTPNLTLTNILQKIIQKKVLGPRHLRNRDILFSSQRSIRHYSIHKNESILHAWKRETTNVTWLLIEKFSISWNALGIPWKYCKMWWQLVNGLNNATELS